MGYTHDIILIIPIKMESELLMLGSGQIFFYQDGIFGLFLCLLIGLYTFHTQFLQEMWRQRVRSSMCFKNKFAYWDFPRVCCFGKESGNTHMIF